VRQGLGLFLADAGVCLDIDFSNQTRRGRQSERWRVADPIGDSLDFRHRPHDNSQDRVDVTGVFMFGSNDLFREKQRLFLADYLHKFLSLIQIE